ncbi:MAG: phosphate/phosphite/phosphonate ABC transporter substrate-binding protein [Nitrospiraceae bacterium]|nr:MAG: phosphate/phosphite/phosphonate ABC transporter substrate-binding protein [Nitrospiraceae bacterium]
MYNLISMCFALFRIERYCCLCALFIVLFISGTCNADNQKAIILEIHPYLPATELIDRFTPLTEYLSRAIGRPVKISIAKDYKDHIDNIGNDKVDIAFLGPASYVKMVKQYEKKQLLARFEIQGKPTFCGSIIVKKNSTIYSLNELAGKRFAFGDPDSTMSHLLPRFMLQEAGVEITALSGYAFLDNHNDVALGVLMGGFDAGAVKEDVFLKYKERGLRELVKTPEISEHVFVATRSLPPGIADTVKDALFKLKNDDKGRTIMSMMRDSLTGLAPANDMDYDNLRSILKKIEEAPIH